VVSSVIVSFASHSTNRSVAACCGMSATFKRGEGRTYQFTLCLENREYLAFHGWRWARGVEYCEGFMDDMAEPVREFLECDVRAFKAAESVSKNEGSGQTTYP
jgi:hypothetical protein